jgi:hypothetical protein
MYGLASSVEAALIAYLSIYSRAPVSTDSVSAVYRGPKKNRELKK